MHRSYSPDFLWPSHGPAAVPLSKRKPAWRVKGAAIVGNEGACHIAAMARADLSSPRGMRLGAATLVLLLHVAAVLALIRAFAPALAAGVVERVTSVFTVEVTPPPPRPPQPPTAEPDREAGAAAAAGKLAIQQDQAAVRPRVVLASPSPAPPVAGKGAETAAGARDDGAGTGAGGQGTGTGSGAGGSGQGAGGAARAVKIAGDINSARDYPKKSRELRLGDHVIVALTVGIDGRVRDCRVHRPSRDAEADLITCKLASERFRFRPATDAAGNPVESVYGWQQRWYDPREKD